MESLNFAKRQHSPLILDMALGWYWWIISMKPPATLVVYPRYFLTLPPWSSKTETLVSFLFSAPADCKLRTSLRFRFDLLVKQSLARRGVNWSDGFKHIRSHLSMCSFMCKCKWLHPAPAMPRGAFHPPLSSRLTRLRCFFSGSGLASHGEYHRKFVRKSRRSIYKWNWLGDYHHYPML